jgi:hypothetical protein
VDRQHRAPRAPAEPERREQPTEPPARLAGTAVGDDVAADAAVGGGGAARPGLRASSSWLLVRLPAEAAREAVHGEGARDGLLRGAALGREPAGAPVPHPRGGADAAVAELQLAAGRLVLVAGERERDLPRDDGAAERAADVVVEPGVDAVDVERVGAAGQLLEPLARRELGEAHGALERPRRGPGPAVLDDGQRGDDVRVEPAGELGGLEVGEEDRRHPLHELVAARAVEQPGPAAAAAAEPAADDEEVVADEDERGDHEPDGDDDGDRERRAALPGARRGGRVRRQYGRARCHARRVHRHATRPGKVNAFAERSAASGEPSRPEQRNRRWGGREA